ncbi:stage II sporulation protein D [Laceyella tengchongensis]|uniref:Stage II sporulation protein D n=2 Tax=Laceyella tengchongensis TaxID=574699 RepID=A0AA45WQL3_9BACL|nr:stage II sporulation protein D [Laceyella tengchongensis]
MTVMGSRGILIGIAGLLLVIMGIPALLVSWVGADTPDAGDKPGKDGADLAGRGSLQVRVYLSKEKRVIQLPLESYIEGVVAAEMPAQFHSEALKAQALAARTYIVGRLMKGQVLDAKEWGEKAGGAHVTDTVQHQAYATDAVLRKKWGYNYPNNKRRVAEAVHATAGQIITYGGKPIYAAFFSTSNGRTENSEDYFKEKYPYLRSVNSSWDQLSPKYISRVSMKPDVFLSKLEHATGKRLAVAALQTTSSKSFAVLSRTQGARIERVRIGGEVFKGREVREALNLPSSDFQLQVKDGQVIITTKGYGHGVGMSQWGANLMAAQGKAVDEIIKHYYQGVEINRLRLD